MENRDLVDQKIEPKFAAIRDLVLTHRDIFVRQGSVVAATRTYRGHRLGPFHSLRFRTEGKQKSVYLGRSQMLAGRVVGLLSDLRKGAQEQRMLQRLKRQARAHLRECKAAWQRDLAPLGLRLKGFEVRQSHGSSSVTTSPASSGKEE